MPTPARAAKTRPPSRNANCDMIRRTQKTAPAGASTPNQGLATENFGATVTRYSLANNDRRPLTIGDEIRENYDGDVDAWIAAVLQLPVEYVREKIAQATRPEAAA